MAAAHTTTTNNAVRYSLGYQLPDQSDSIDEIVADFRSHIDEVYFAWPGQASGRSPVGTLENIDLADAERIMVDELRAVGECGVRLTLLLNANCYGHEAASLTLENRVVEQIGRIRALLDISAVTTASPFVARVVKNTFPSLETRASVNMRVGTVGAMECLRGFFDGFYMQREYNRSPRHIRKLRTWCDANGKKLYMLVNSGCLSHCPFQTYHDNLVAHEADIDPAKYRPRDPSYCREHMRSESHYADFLRATWIRPEDMRHYAGLFDGYKLASRMHANPRRIVAAYARGRFNGNLPDLTEPGFSFGRMMVDNALFPENWHEKISSCANDCQECRYCDDVLEKVMSPAELQKFSRNRNFSTR